MPTVMKWFSVLLLANLVSVAAVGGVHANEISQKKKPLAISLRYDQISPELSDPELTRTIKILERRIGNRQLPRQTKEKLLAMDTAERRLVIMLCDRIASAGDKPGADVALLFATALIVLS